MSSVRQRNIQTGKSASVPTVSDSTQTINPTDSIPEYLQPSPPPITGVHNKSLFIALILWCTGGFWGWHHLYLERDTQAVIWFGSFGGFVVGWLRDLWRLSDYVAVANREYTQTEILKSTMRVYPSPPWTVIRLIGMLWMGYWFGGLFAALPGFWAPDPLPSFTTLREAIMTEQIWRSAALALRVVGVSVGVYLTGNAVQLQRSSYAWTLLGAAIGQVLALTIFADTEHVSMTSDSSNTDNSWSVALVAIAFYQYKRTWNTDVVSAQTAAGVTSIPVVHRSTRGGCVRLFRYAVGCLVMAALISNWSLHNLEVNEVKLKTAIHNVRTSKEWHEFWDAASTMYERSKQKGWQQSWNDLLEEFDVDGSTNAYKILELDASRAEEYTLRDIARARNKLAVKWHPDKYTGNDKEEAQKKFTAIQSAYETLEKKFKKKNNRSANIDPENDSSNPNAGQNRRRTNTPPTGNSDSNSNTGNSKSNSKRDRR